MSHVKNIAIVGATGTVGAFITKSLLATGKHSVTALTRSAANPDAFPAGLQLAEISYSDPATIVRALRGQDVLIITMSVHASAESQLTLIDAAADAGVPYVMPNDWGFDVSRDDMYRDAFFHLDSKAARARIEQRGVSAWVSVICGFWYEHSLGCGLGTFGIDWDKREAVLLDGGDATRMNTSTCAYVGQAVAALLSLPEKAAESAAGGASLEQFKNDYVRISEFTVTQREMLDAVQRATATADADWAITHEDSRERYKRAAAEVVKGNYALFETAMYSRVWFPDGSSLYEDRGLHDEILGLQRDGLDEATKRAVERGLKGY
ncbi:oxidoreductase CipA [Microdochium bolleyi]|uniref:Oxidoreductase CipA n=1 Tax=Microdochium bolleyi TaxID=196109 RepID=A0A136IN29_9PEZI|nr:oxidoreductase CipA [Microdochium bolleyi]